MVCPSCPRRGSVEPIATRRTLWLGLLDAREPSTTVCTLRAAHFRSKSGIGGQEWAGRGRWSGSKFGNRICWRSCTGMLLVRTGEVVRWSESIGKASNSERWALEGERLKGGWPRAGQSDSHLNCLRQLGRGCGRRPARAKIRPMRARVEATCQVKLPLASVATGAE